MKDDLMGCCIGRYLGGVDGDLWMLRSLVWVVDAGELLDQAGPGLGVQAFAIPGLADLERG